MDLSFLRAYRWLCLATFELIVFGGAVRALNAGLACPDWPLCFGDLIPDFHPQVYLEFLHRAFAGGIALGVLGLNGYLLFQKRTSQSVRVLATISFFLLASQIVLGGLTVLFQLQAGIVTAHLALGTALLLTLLWIYFRLQPQGDVSTSSISIWTPRAAVLLMILIYAQMLLGGAVATNYAALVCTDFPTCYGQWIPTLRGIIGLHVLHRLGAYLVCLSVIGYAMCVLRGPSTGELRRRAKQLLILLSIQMVLGVTNVIAYRPPLITILHLATATGLLTLALRSAYLGYRQVRYSASGCLEGSAF